MRIFDGFDQIRSAVGYGADRIRYSGPVPPHHRRNLRRSGVNYHLVIEIEGGQRPACVAIALHYR